MILCETKIKLLADIDIKLSIPKEIEFYGQENQLVMMFVNFINNAIDALGEQKKPQFKILAKSVKNLLTIKISDNGEGIPSENINKVFNKGFSTKEHGTGLGLDFINLVVKNHHGRIFIDENTPETCFVIEILLFNPPGK